MMTFSVEAHLIKLWPYSLVWFKALPRQGRDHGFKSRYGRLWERMYQGGDQLWQS
jgi:hypothetical protein